MAENAMRIDMIRPNSRTSSSRSMDAVSEGRETDFADMLKRKEQISDTADKKTESSVKNTLNDPGKNSVNDEKDTESGKETETVKKPENGKKNAFSQSDLTGAQVLSETMLKLQADINQLMDGHEAESTLNVQAAGEAMSQMELVVTEAVTAETPITGTEMIAVKMAAAETVPELQPPEDGAVKKEFMTEFAEQAKQEIFQSQIQSAESAGDGAEAVNPLMNNVGKEEKAEASQTPLEAGSRAEVPKAENDLEQQAAFTGEKQSGSDDPADSELADEGQVQAMGHQAQNTVSAPESRAAETPVVKTTPETLPADVGKALADKMPQKDGTLTIDLEPASLGKLTIKVVYEEGRAMVSILSTNQKTLELLSQRAADIAGILEEKTGQQTVIYTQPSEQQPFEEKQDSQAQDREQQRHDREEGRRQSRPDTFAQQLRLGLV